MEKFYSLSYNCMIQQISKRTAKRLFEDGKEIFIQSSNMTFENVWQSAAGIEKAYLSYGETFETVCNSYLYYNCDNYRGKYIHFFIREKDLNPEKKTIREMSDSEINELSIRQINALMLKEDDSKLFPICGRFNVTKRAIRKLRTLRQKGMEVNPGLEYYLSLNDIISQIVNSQF